MNEIVIRNLDDTIVQQLRQIAWQEGRPLEETARRLLAEAVSLRAIRQSRARIPIMD